MPFLQQESVTVTTDASGNATAFTAASYNGFLQTIVYTIDGTTPYSNGVVIAITGETSGVSLWSQTLASNISTTLSPRIATHTTAGAASLYAAGGTAVTFPIPLAGERIKIVLSSGGNTLKGAFRFIVGG